jgi:3-hydroxybutyryl-CoA dehydratase
LTATEGEPVPRISFDDIQEGRTVQTAGRTITEADIVNFAGISGDFNPLHTDELWVRENTDFRGRIAHGILALAISGGLRSEVDEWDVLAYLECTRRFVAPVFPGDTIRTHYTVTETRASRSRPDRGIVVVAVELHNQDGEVVQSGQDTYLVARPPS